MAYIGGAAPPMIAIAGAPSAGTDEVQTLTITGTPTGGTFKLSFEGYTTAAIAYNAAAAAVQSALRLLPPLAGASGDVACGGGALPGTPVTMTFQFDRGRQAVSLVTVVEAAFTGGTAPAAAVVETTPGVDATYRGMPKETILRRTSNGVLYVQTSANVNAPTWTLVHTPS